MFSQWCYLETPPHIGRKLPERASGHIEARHPSQMLTKRDFARMKHAQSSRRARRVGRELIIPHGELLIALNIFVQQRSPACMEDTVSEDSRHAFVLVCRCGRVESVGFGGIEGIEGTAERGVVGVEAKSLGEEVLPERWRRLGVILISWETTSEKSQREVVFRYWVPTYESCY